MSWADAPGVVELPDGGRVRGRSLAAPAAFEGEEPEFGVYLTWRRPPPQPWPARWVRWPDFWLPTRPAEALAALREAHRHAREGRRVEVACAGGRGRTGTALACIARIAGVPADEAVVWIRERYDPRAVETRWQARFVRRFRAMNSAAPRGRTRR